MELEKWNLHACYALFVLTFFFFFTEGKPCFIKQQITDTKWLWILAYNERIEN